MEQRLKSPLLHPHCSRKHYDCLTGGGCWQLVEHPSQSSFPKFRINYVLFHTFSKVHSDVLCMSPYNNLGKTSCCLIWKLHLQETSPFYLNHKYFSCVGLPSHPLPLLCTHFLHSRLCSRSSHCYA